MDRISRRRVLYTIPWIGLAGCSTTGRENTSENRYLSTIILWNRTNTSQTIEFKLERNNSEVLSGQKTLGPVGTKISSTDIAEDLEHQQGKFVLSVRLNDQGKWKKYRVSEISRGKCYGFEVRIAEGGEFNVWHTIKGDCQSTSE